MFNTTEPIWTLRICDHYTGEVYERREEQRFIQLPIGGDELQITGQVGRWIVVDFLTDYIGKCRTVYVRPVIWK